MKLTKKECRHIVDGLTSMVQSYWNPRVNYIDTKNHKECKDLRERFIPLIKEENENETSRDR